MTRPFHHSPEQDKALPSERPIQERFDYMPLTAEVAQQVQTSVQRIRDWSRQSLEGLLAIGRELLAIKETLPHGQFGLWLKAEFGWSERMARRLMAVARRFGPKTDIMAVLPIEPTAVYLLAAPSTPEEAIAVAIQRAQSGECITGAVADQIVSAKRKKRVRRARKSSVLPAGRLMEQLLESLESFRERWNPQQFPLLARQLREFADSLDDEQPERKSMDEK